MRTAVCRAQPLLGTLVQIQAAGLAEAGLHGAVDAAFAAIRQVHALMSVHDPASELSGINRAAVHACQPLHAHTRAVLAAALRFAELSAGAFDPCVADVLVHWGCLPAQVAGAAAVAAPAGSGRMDMTGSARSTSAGPGAMVRGMRPCWRDIELSARGVRFARPLAIDLGGIAKGYAVDLAVQVLLEHGVRQLCVNAGGDLRVAGEEAGEVRLRHPLEPAVSVRTLTLRNEALATSAACFSRRRLPDAEVSALVEPHTRRPWLGADSVSVRARDCTSADALTKIVLFAAPAAASRALEACDAEALVLAVGTWRRAPAGPASAGPGGARAPVAISGGRADGGGCGGARGRPAPRAHSPALIGAPAAGPG